ncbi:MAG: MFS transporter [Pseudomonadota bacterium]
MSASLPLPCPDLTTAPAATPCPNKTQTLVATIIASSLAFVLGSIINVALPQMRADFDVGPAGAQWIVNAYLLPLGAFVLMGGALGDHYGRKKVFQVGLLVFAASCLLCAIAWSFPVLLAARALEGVAAAMIAPTSLAIIADTFPEEERGQAVGTWAGIGAAAGAVAPVIGGLIVDSVGWRWAFVAVVPIALLGWAIARRAVRESRAPRQDCAPLDWTGAALISAGLLALIWGLIAAPVQGLTPPVTLALFAAALLLGAYIVAEARLGDRAMTPLPLFRNVRFSGLTVFTLLLYGALGGFMLLLPYVLIEDLGYGASAAGAAILPFPLILGLLSRFAGGALVARFGTRLLLSVGAGLVGLGFLLFAQIPSTDVSYARHILPGLLALAFGMALSVAPLTAAVLASAGPNLAGVASGINNAVSRIGGLVATALLGVVLVGSADDLLAGFARAAWAGVALALAAATTAAITVRNGTA